ncbi:Smr/MutS family protein [Maribellus mangrovi]|uniref:Smr/MutS family protein n=1 Tax=Maribellus mangrovi TaxID=3133146 RepID=UPI0030ED7DE3
MIKVGDRVKFLNDVGGGVVTGFVNKNTVNVEGDDGFEVPYPIKELVNINAPELNVRSNNPVQQEAPVEVEKDPEYIEPKGEIINGKNNPDFYFCFVPTDPKNPLSGEIELYLVNDSNFTVLYSYSYIITDGVEAVNQGTVRSNSREKIDALVQEDLSDLPDFGFQLIYFRDSESEWNPPMMKKFRISPVKFYKESTFQPNSYFRSNALVLKIASTLLENELDRMSQDDFKKLVQEKAEQPVAAKPVKRKTQDEVVIDLHITELLDNAEGLSNREILEIQMEKVESEMNAAIRDRVKRIVFIHGVGQGVLKQEVTKLLQRNFKKYYFQDASFKEYGYGATMVILRR